jgi:hypothetical protein
MISTPKNGDSSITSSAPRPNSSPNKELVQRPSNDTIDPKPPTRGSWSPLLSCPL